MVKVKAELLGMALAGKPADVIADEIDDLPQAARVEVAWAAFKETGAPENVLGLADLLIDEEAWEKLEQPETVPANPENRPQRCGQAKSPTGR